MDGIHDMGGMDGFGRVEPEQNEPVFHEAWEGRVLAMSALGGSDDEGWEPAVAPDRFLPADHAQWPGHWATPPQPWSADPEAGVLARETRACIEAAIRALPPNQRDVIALRDVQGWTPEEVAEALGITDGNQRVLLHRARAKVRAALEAHLAVA